MGMMLLLTSMIAIYELDQMSIHYARWMRLLVCVVIVSMVILCPTNMMILFGLVSLILSIVIVNIKQFNSPKIILPMMLLNVCVGMRSAWLIWYDAPTLLFNIILLTWASDSAAYLVGSTLGKHRLVPNISPNKTLEGFLASIVVGLCWVWLPYTVAIAIVVVGIWGDLCESILKRSVGIKDSGNIFPGHGGILDRIDSLIATWFVGFICLQYHLI